MLAAPALLVFRDWGSCQHQDKCVPYHSAAVSGPQCCIYITVQTVKVSISLHPAKLNW